MPIHAAAIARVAAALAVGALLFSCPAAHAQTDEQTVLALEGAFALPIGEPERDRFEPGGSLAVAGYRSLHPVFAIGLRLRGSLFGNGGAPMDPTLEDEGVGGLYSLSVAARLRPFGQGNDRARFTGPYIEVAGGGALTEDVVRPALEAAIGWTFPAGDVGLGPVVRYQWVPHEGALQDDDGHFLMMGLEAVFLDARGTYEPPEEPRAAPVEPDPCPGEEDLDGFEDDDGCPDVDNDRDGILDREDHCPNIPETFNGYNDHDGCPDASELVMIDDRVVLNDDVFFDFDEAELRPRGRSVIQQLADLWNRHPEWTGMIVEGHADARGSREYNQDLSERRARAVRQALLDIGFPATRVRVRAQGETDPQVPDADTEREHQLNRRVEFIVDRTVPAVQTQDHPNAPAEGDDQ